MYKSPPPAQSVSVQELEPQEESAARAATSASTSSANLWSSNGPLPMLKVGRGMLLLALCRKRLENLEPQNRRGKAALVVRAWPSALMLRTCCAALGGRLELSEAEAAFG